jgi:hypothetical protein
MYKNINLSISILKFHFLIGEVAHFEWFFHRFSGGRVHLEVIGPGRRVVSEYLFKIR